MRNSRSFWMLFGILPLFLFMMAPESSQHSSSGAVMIGKVLNFIILFGGLGFLLRKAIRDFLEAKARQISQELKEAAQWRQEWQEKREEITSRLAKLDEELIKIRQESARQAEIRKKEIIKLAQQEAERVKALTRKEIEWLYQKNLLHLKEYAAEMAIQLARKKIKEALSPERHRQIVAKSISSLGKLYEKFVDR